MKTKLLAMPVIHYVARRFGWPALRKAALDAKFLSGTWSGFEEPDCLVQLVEKHAAGGQVIFLGCGANPLGKRMSPASYSSAIGVDLSPVAIGLAREHAPERQSFEVGDMLSYSPENLPVNVVVFSESIYYLPLADILPLLEKWSACLSGEGRIIVTLATPERWKGIVDLIRANFRVETDRPMAEGGTRWVLVFN